MSEIRVSPANKPLRGRIDVPADKSISHRAAIVAALAEGDTRIGNYLESATTNATLTCLGRLGVQIDHTNTGTPVVHGRGLRSLREPDQILFCSGSGTTMRLLAGVCAGQSFLSILDGTPALNRRPMARISEPLRLMGARILGRDGGRLPPLAIQGGQLHAIEYALPVASAQVKSALLLAGLFADSPTSVREPVPSRDHTERMLRACGIDIDTNQRGRVRIHPTDRLVIPPILDIPNDLSSAAFLIVAALLVPQSDIRLENIGINSTRTGLIDVLERMGARISAENQRAESGEPVADIEVRAADSLRGVDVGGEIVPRMIDEFPILAVAATQAAGETTVRDARELRVKESDRIGTLAAELRKIGAQIEERPDGFVISGPTHLKGSRVSAHGDHRLAMALAVAALVSEGETLIDGWECTADSFPNFEQIALRVT